MAKDGLYQIYVITLAVNYMLTLKDYYLYYEVPHKSCVEICSTVLNARMVAIISLLTFCAY